MLPLPPLPWNCACASVLMLLQSLKKSNLASGRLMIKIWVHFQMNSQTLWRINTSLSIHSYQTRDFRDLDLTTNMNIVGISFWQFYFLSLFLSFMFWAQQEYFMNILRIMCMKVSYLSNICKSKKSRKRHLLFRTFCWKMTPQ